MKEIILVDGYLEVKIKIPDDKHTESLEYAMRALLYELNGDIVNLIDNPNSFDKIVSSHQKRLKELKNPDGVV